MESSIKRRDTLFEVCEEMRDLKLRNVYIVGQ